MGDLQSNLANALNDFGLKDADALQPLGDILGTIADVAGAVPAIGGFISLVISLFNSGPDQLQQVATAIEQFLQQFEQAEAAQAFTDRLTNIQNQVANALKVVQSLPSLSAALPLAPSDISDKLQGTLQALDALAPPDISGLGCGIIAGAGGPWSVPFNFQVYWNDSDSPDTIFEFFRNGYGQQAPKANQDGSVFNYVYILPAYLYAVSAFLSAAVVIDPNFKQNWSDTVIRPAACLLLSVHNFILNHGITTLSPPEITGDNLRLWSASVKHVTEGLNPTTPVPGPVTIQPGILPVVSVLGSVLAGAKIEYGAVEKFSGFSSMANYILLEPFAANSDGKLRIRLLKRAKDVYVGVGLVRVLEVINNLKRVAGDAPLPGPRINEWSFRRDITPFTPVGGIRGSFSLRSIAKYIEQTPPADALPGLLSTSFRKLLTV